MNKIFLICAFCIGCSVASVVPTHQEEQDGLQNLESETFLEWRSLHGRFFDSLNKDEKRAIMIMAFEVCPNGKGCNSNSDRLKGKNDDDKGEPGFKPIPAIPMSLQRKMTNGEIPAKWAEKFVDWVIYDRQEDITKYTNSSTRCLAGMSCDDFDDLGSSCCPFG